MKKRNVQFAEGTNKQFHKLKAVDRLDNWRLYRNITKHWWVSCLIQSSDVEPIVTLTKLSVLVCDQVAKYWLKYCWDAWFCKNSNLLKLTIKELDLLGHEVLWKWYLSIICPWYGNCSSNYFQSRHS